MLSGNSTVEAEQWGRGRYKFFATVGAGQCWEYLPLTPSKRLKRLVLQETLVPICGWYYLPHHIREVDMLGFPVC
jgi:hypothetical protein